MPSKSYLNIERHHFQKRTNVGYGGGEVWIIKRTAGNQSQWCAKPRHEFSKSAWFYGDNLDEISHKLDMLDIRKAKLDALRKQAEELDV